MLKDWVNFKASLKNQIINLKSHFQNHGHNREKNIKPLATHSMLSLKNSLN